MSGPVAITGGFGYLGGRLAVFLRDAGFTVRLLTRDPARPRPTWAADIVVAGMDLGDPASVAAALAGADAVVHLAALNARDCAADPAAAERVNVGGTRTVVDAARAGGARRLVYMSTAHVYGAPLAGRLDETSPTANTHPYAATHARAETIVRAADGLEGVVLRLSNGVGAPMDAEADCWMLVANDLCRQAVETGTLVLRGTGQDQRDFISIAEVARAVGHVLRLDAARLGDGLFNLASGTSMTTLDLAQRIAGRAGAVLGRTPALRHAPDDGVRPATVNVSTKRLAEAGFFVDGDLTAEIDGTLAFCREHFGHG